MSLGGFSLNTARRLDHIIANGTRWVVNTLRPFVSPAMADHKHGGVTRKRGRSRGITFSFPSRKRHRGMHHKSTRSLVKKLLRGREVKIHDILVQNTAFTAAGVMIGLNSISGGGANDERDGTKVNFFNIDIRWQCVLHSSDVVTQCRVIVFRDSMQVASTVPLPAQLMSTTSPLSQVNVLNRNRFVVFYDRTMVVGTGMGRVKTGRFNKRVAFETHWSGATAGSHLKNGLYMLIITDESTNFPTFNWSSRLMYNDL